ncbi:hypothetical protein HPB48_007977 [Haemaphysalis longicornis]|uniref:Uncharacterized protein n=1 Tax=Haemaphysalis longicornis TaxID=44386 RepID=A0A9J6F9K6_HAELO|nr:hypothetical protein HPB48_007977 [Haemaphysalis longicornis]
MHSPLPHLRGRTSHPAPLDVTANTGNRSSREPHQPPTNGKKTSRKFKQAREATRLDPSVGRADLLRSRTTLIGDRGKDADFQRRELSNPAKRQKRGERLG